MALFGTVGDITINGQTMPMRNLAITCDPIEVTQGGWFGGQPDVFRRFVAGPPRYTIDDTDVDRATFIEAWTAMGGDANEVP